MSAARGLVNGVWMRYPRHPDSGAQIEGVVIPRWGELVESVRRLAQKLDFIDYNGWDVVATEEGLSVIEGNYSFDLYVYQVSHPLLTDERIRAFYRRQLSLRGPAPRGTSSGKDTRVPLDLRLGPGVASTMLLMLQWRYALLAVLKAFRGIRGWPFFGSLRMIALGFQPHRQKRYRFGQWPTKRQYRQYLTDVQQARVQWSSVARKRGYVLTADKVRFAEVISDMVATPKTLAVIEYGQVFPTAPDVPTPDAEGLFAAARTHGGLVLKPRNGSAGAGILFLLPTDDGLRINREPVEPAGLDERIRSFESYIVTPRVHQAQYAADLFEETTNTIRVVTMVNRATGEPFPVYAVQRIGTRSSFPVDNFEPGGLCCGIDLATGRLGPALRSDDIWYEKHPDTGVPIKGVVVPRWGELLELVLRLARRLDFLTHVGWDLVVTDERFSVIEGNGHPGLHQMHGPLLVDERVRAFYKRQLALGRSGAWRMDR